MDKKSKKAAIVDMKSAAIFVEMVRDTANGYNNLVYEVDRREHNSIWEFYTGGNQYEIVYAANQLLEKITDVIHNFEK